jgi:hypothetical protein
MLLKATFLNVVPKNRRLVQTQRKNFVPLLALWPDIYRACVAPQAFQNPCCQLTFIQYFCGILIKKGMPSLIN